MKRESARPKDRPATPEDADSIAECLAELGYDTPASLVARRLVEFENSAANIVFVAFQPGDHKALGVVSAHALPLFHTQGHLVRLTAFAVRRSAQGMGVGRLLVASAEQWAWDLGAARIEATSGDHRPAAHRFYLAAGYSVDERRFIKHAPATAGCGS